MTREEIEEFSRVELNCFETDREEDWYKIGCIDGLKAADAEPNLKSLWHDACEEPKGGNWKILYVDVFNECWVESKFNAVLLHNKWGEYKWDEYIATELVKMWAYIDDLLPKGGKQ